MAIALDEETRKKTQVTAPAFPQNPPPSGTNFGAVSRPDQAIRNAMPATGQAVDDARERVTSAFQQGNTAAGVGQIARGAVMAPLVAATEVGANLLGAAGDIAGTVAKPVAQAAYTAVTGNNDKLFAGGATPAAATVPSFQRGSLPSPTPGTGSVGTGARAANSLDNLTARAEAPEPGQSVVAPAADPDSPQARGYNQVGPDIFRKGNSFTDEAGTREGGFGVRAPVTAQANAAAENVAGGFGANQQALGRLQANNASGAAGAGAQPQTLAMPSVKTSANDWQARNDLRSLRVSANSLANERRWGGDGARSTDAIAYQKALDADNALKEGKNPMAQEMLQQQGGLARAQVQDAGATERAAMGEQGATTRAGMTNQVQRGELAVKQGEFGIRSRAEARLQDAQDAFIKADTPEKEAAALRRMQAITGRGGEKFTVVRGGQQYDPEANAMRNLPDMVIDSQGRPIAMGGAAQSQQQRGPAPGTVQDGFRFKGGNPADQSNWEKVR